MFTEIQIASLTAILGSVVASVGISLILFTFLPKKDKHLREDVEKLKTRINSIENK
jgi:hypothetical protein